MVKYIFALILAITLFPLQALAQDTGNICINDLDGIGGYVVTIIGFIVTIASALANTVDKTTVWGKLIHFFAVNITVDKVKK